MKFLRPRKGTVYTGPVTFSTDYSLVPRPGYYALKPDGKQLAWPRLRLICVDDAPGDQHDGAHHFEVARRRDPVARFGNPVELEAHAHGDGAVTAE